MTLRSFSQARTNLVQFLGIILLCLGYFNYFIIAESISIFFQISSLTGQVLVNKFISLCKCTFEIVKLTYSFSQILYEDSLIFLKDATEKFAYALYLLKELYIFLEEFGWHLFSTLFKILETFLEFFRFLLLTFTTLKEGIQLTGSAIWQTFMNIPEIVILNISAVNQFFKNSLIELRALLYELKERIFESLVNIYKFLFYVPFDSVCGLIIGAVLVAIICVKFKDICYLVSSAFLKLYRQMASFGISLWNGQFLETKTRRYIAYSNEDDERLCIICQNQLKEIIIFPCKHLCLCGDCMNQLTKSQPNCPICRSNITGTLKVYI